MAIGSVPKGGIPRQHRNFLLSTKEGVAANKTKTAALQKQIDDLRQQLAVLQKKVSEL